MAVSLVGRAGVDPNALVRSIQRVQHPIGPLAASWSALPPVRKRVASMKAGIAKLPASAYPITNGSEFREATAEVRRLLATSPRSDAPSLKSK